MASVQLIYRSRPFGFDQGILNGILADARKCNARDGLTGALICRADIYLQLLEGPQAAVEATYARILRDDRHTEITLLSMQPMVGRLFAAWSMLDDPARSWLWSQAEVASGALDTASPADLRAVFERLLGEVA